MVKMSPKKHKPNTNYYPESNSTENDVEPLVTDSEATTSLRQELRAAINTMGPDTPVNISERISEIEGSLDYGNYPKTNATYNAVECKPAQVELKELYKKKLEPTTDESKSEIDVENVDSSQSYPEDVPIIICPKDTHFEEKSMEERIMNKCHCLNENFITLQRNPVPQQNRRNSRLDRHSITKWFKTRASCSKKENDNQKEPPEFYKMCVTQAEDDHSPPRRLVFNLIDELPKPKCATIGVNTKPHICEPVRQSKEYKDLRNQKAKTHGQDNETFEEYNTMHKRNEAIHHKIKGCRCGIPARVDVYYFDHGNASYLRTTDNPPLIRTEIVADQSEELNIKFWGEIFGTVHIGTSFITSFILQLFRGNNKNDNNIDPTLKIGGLSEQIKKIEKYMNNSLTLGNNKERTRFFVLLYGNSGTGKTMLANAVAKKSKVNIVSINPDLYKQPPIPPEQTIQIIFEKAISNGPTVMVIDEVEKLCPADYSKISDTEKRVMGTLLLFLDKLKEDKNAKVFIICTTNKIDSIDTRFRRIGRFDCEIEIHVPNPEARKDILEKLLGDFEHNISNEQMLEVSTATHGFVGLDLEALCCHAKDHACDSSRNLLCINDLKHAMKFVKASAMREVQVEVSNVKWSDIGGQENLKKILKQSVEWPLKHAESILRMGYTPSKGILMYGPPGCSKTMIAKAVATESGLNFLSIKGAELLSKWVGDSEKAVMALFKKAKEVAPSVIFFDEIDVIAATRSSGASNNVIQERVLTQLLIELNGITALNDVVVLAATNRPDRIDDALLRQGRFDRIVYVPLPDDKTRMEIFKLKLTKIPADVDVYVFNLNLL